MIVQRIGRWASSEVIGGILLLSAALIGFLWANSPFRAAFHDLAAAEFGPASLHLHLSSSAWAADALLAIFFFTVGVELKQEFVAGSLRDPEVAGVPIFAAIGGMVVPALCYVAVVGSTDSEALRGWAIPTATDIAFALAVLAVFGRGLPGGLRTFLLTLAVVDDLLGIIVIATVYTDTINRWYLAASLVVIVVFGVLVRRRRPRSGTGRLIGTLVLIALAVIAWTLMHASGVHATVAGVLLGFAVPARNMHGETSPRTHVLERAVKPFSSGIALPVFAFFAAGVTVVGGGFEIVQPVSIGIVLGLVVGKIVGVVAATVLTTRFTSLRLPDGLVLRDTLPVAMLTGVGFTVALLIADLSFGDGADAADHASAATVAILVGSIIAAVLAAVLMRYDIRSGRATAAAVPEDRS